MKLVRGRASWRQKSLKGNWNFKIKKMSHYFSYLGRRRLCIGSNYSNVAVGRSNPGLQNCPFYTLRPPEDTWLRRSINVSTTPGAHMLLFFYGWCIFWWKNASVLWNEERRLKKSEILFVMYLTVVSTPIHRSVTVRISSFDFIGNK